MLSLNYSYSIVGVFITKIMKSSMIYFFFFYFKKSSMIYLSLGYKYYKVHVKILHRPIFFNIFLSHRYNHTFFTALLTLFFLHRLYSKRGVLLKCYISWLYFSFTILDCITISHSVKRKKKFTWKEINIQCYPIKSYTYIKLHFKK